MEMEGRSFSDLFRNSTEEMFLKSVMENPIGASTPTSVEMLGFREDSEKLFNSWLMSAEARICNLFLLFSESDV